MRFMLSRQSRWGPSCQMYSNVTQASFHARTGTVRSQLNRRAMMCGLKFYTDQECGHKGQPFAVSERSSSDDGVGSNLTSKMYPNVTTRSLLCCVCCPPPPSSLPPPLLLCCPPPVCFCSSFSSSSYRLHIDMWQSRQYCGHKLGGFTGNIGFINQREIETCE